MSEAIQPFSEHRRSVYPKIDTAADFANWLNKVLSEEVPDAGRLFALMVVDKIPGEEDAYMIGVRYDHTLKSEATELVD